MASEDYRPITDVEIAREVQRLKDNYGTDISPYYGNNGSLENSIDLGSEIDIHITGRGSGVAVAARALGRLGLNDSGPTPLSYPMYYDRPSDSTATAALPAAEVDDTITSEQEDALDLPHNVPQTVNERTVIERRVSKKIVGSVAILAAVLSGIGAWHAATDVDPAINACKVNVISFCYPTQFAKGMIDGATFGATHLEGK